MKDEASESPSGDGQAASVRKIGPSFAEPQRAGPDLSEEIVNAVTRSADERVTCRRVRGDHYRCNWWTPQNSGSDGRNDSGMGGLTVTTHRVSRSELLIVTKSADGLTITPASSRR